MSESPDLKSISWDGAELPSIGSTPTVVGTEPYILMLDPLSQYQPGELTAHLPAFADRQFVEHLTPVLGMETNDGFAIPGQMIHEDPRLKDRIADDDGVQDFLDQVMESRKAGREPAEFGPEDKRVTQDLTEIRFHLLKAAYALTKLFADTWAESLSPVNDWRVHSVEFGFDPRGSSGVVLAELKKSLEAVKKFESHQGQFSTAEQQNHLRLLLGADGIEVRLQSMIKDFATLKRLDGALVEWLTDLFWHTLIFESPCYPRPDELAFQLSLAANASSAHPTRKYEPTAMVERHADDRFRRAIKYSIRRAMKGGDNAPRVRGRLQDAAAASLVAQFRVRQAQPLRHPFPIAISLTSDLELEKSLAFHGQCGVFHVAFPVVHAMTLKGKGTLRWIVGTFKGGGADLPTTADQVWANLSAPIDGWRWLNDVVRPGFEIDEPGDGREERSVRGPLILKVNGSPLHHVLGDASAHQHLAPDLQRSIRLGELPPSRVADKPLGHLIHVPAVTELDVLQLAQIDDWSRGARQQDEGQHKAGLPLPLVNELMSPNRFWLIAGHDLSDWSARLQLFGQISRSVLTEDGSQALAVSRKTDVDRARLLANLGIPICFGCFEGLSDAIQESARRSLQHAGLEKR